MTAVSVQLANAVVSVLKGASLSMEIDPQRSYMDWDFDTPAEDDGLHVDVVAVTDKQTCELATRGSVRYMVPVDIAVRKKFDQNARSDQDGRLNVSQVDPLVALVEEINEFLVKKRLTDSEAGVWQSEELLALPHNRHLRELGQFTGVIRLMCRFDKALS